MIHRVEQRGQLDCVTCVVSMVMGSDFPYERVDADSERYQKTKDGKFYEWWVEYLQHNGFRVYFRPFSGLYQIKCFGGEVVGILGLTIPHERMRHVVAVDELGIVDPSTGAPDHFDIAEYVKARVADGLVFDEKFLAVKLRMPRL